MAKKKGKKGKKDTRGYQTGSSSAAKTVTTQPPSSSQPASRHRNHHHAILDQLRAHIQLTTTTTTTTYSPAALETPRFRSRLNRTVDQLLGYGFTWEQIGQAIGSVGSVVVTEDSASSSSSSTALLDWLCWHLPTEELPPIFTEGYLRDAATASAAAADVPPLEIVSRPVVAAAIASTTTTNNNNVSAATTTTFDTGHPHKMLVKKEEEETDDTIVAKKQKAWLLSQYEFEEDEEVVETLDDTVPDPSQRNPSTIVEKDSSVESIIAEARSSPEVAEKEAAPPLSAADPISKSTVVIELESLQRQLQELEEDLSNEANNYMRSKQETKAMRQQSKQLRKRIQGVQGRIAKEAAKSKTVVIPNNPTEEDFDEEVGAGFDLFGDTAPSSAVESEKPVEDTVAGSSSIVVPSDHIPSSWTGTTPRRVLEDWCRNEKLRPPQFMGNRRVKVLTDPPIMIDNGPNDHVVAAQALYQAVPQLPLYRLFPPFYRELWLSWLGEDKQQAIEEAEMLAAERTQKLDWIISLIPKRRKESSPTKEMNGMTSSLCVDVQKQNSLDTGDLSDWDDNEDDDPTRSNDGKISSEGSRLQALFRKRQSSRQYLDMMDVRRKLPMYDHKQEVLESIQSNPVTIICAETEDALAKGTGDATSILCTQPRRVAAVSVAERVAEELGEAAIGNLVGYSIKGENRRCSATRLLFCTTGVILRRLIQDPHLRGVSHVVVDEVHERQWQIDILLVFLRSLITSKRPDLKVVLMSATLDSSLFSNFFAGAPVLNIPGRTFPVQTFYLEDLLERTHHIIEEGSRCALRGGRKRETVSLWVTNKGGEKRRETADYLVDEDLSGLYPDYSVSTQRSLDLVDETVINYDLIEDVLAALEDSTEPFLEIDDKHNLMGSVLIFMPGIGEIRTLVDRLTGSRRFGDTGKYDVMPLHSTLSSQDQRRAFRPSPEGCRKIIVSTNIAETSVTIPDVVYVIDSGRVREIQRDKRSSSRKLVPTWCSKASAKQRAGRAGRVQEGVCLKLFSSNTEGNIMRVSTDPELRRIPLEEVCLSVLASNFTSSCSEFLHQTLQPPTSDAVEAALKVLLDIGAITRVGNSEYLTPLGKHLAKLPVDARVGKMLIYGAIFRCIDPILTIASSLSTTKELFQASQNGDVQAQAAHNSFMDPSSDFLSFDNLWAEFRKSRRRGESRKFARDSCVNYGTLMEIQENRLHFAELLRDLGFLGIPMTRMSQSESEAAILSCSQNANAKMRQLIDSIVCGGLFPNVGRVTLTKAKETTICCKNEELTVKGSVNSKLSDQHLPRWLTFYEKFATQRQVSVTKTALVTPFSLMLFGSELEVLHTQRRVRVDGWMELEVPAKTALVFREVRYCLDQVLRDFVDDPQNGDKLVERTSQILDGVTELLSGSA